MKKNKRILVTQPTLPNLDEFVISLKEIWESKYITNNGKFHKEFEKKLAKHLGVKYVSLFNNGTMALISALQVLRITGEVITTPYSFVATTNALHWNNIKPVFVDINKEDKNLDPEKIEAAITPQTTAIVPVHVYGNPANVERIQEIADIYGLKVIYDAAHAFGVTKNNQSILNFGDLSILSFHATKTFNTIEGGAIICQNEKTKKRIDFLKNFGFASETTIVAPGINAKMNELQAAYGILQLNTIDEQIEKRKLIAYKYRELLKNINGISYLNDFKGIKHNYAYFPIFVESDYTLTREELYDKLKENNIFTRRYFYPLISDFPPYRGLHSSKSTNLPTATETASQVICLPIYPELDLEDVQKIVKLIRV